MPARKRRKPVKATAGLRPRAARSWEVADYLRKELSRRFRPGQRLPPERELARQLGVCRDTVRMAVGELVREGWITSAPRKGHLASRPMTRTTAATGLYCGTTPHTLATWKWAREVYSGVIEAIDAAGRLLLPLFGRLAETRELTPAVFWSQRMGEVDSLLTLGVYNADVVEQAAKLVPVVTLDWNCRVPGVSSVTFDHEMTTRMGLKYLLDLGHRRIGFIGTGPGWPSANELRLAAYRRMLHRNGLPIDEAWVLTIPHVPDMLTRLLKQLRQTPADRRPTALLVSDAIWQVAVALLVAGLQCPQDMSLVSIGVAETWQDFIEMPYDKNAGELPGEALRRQWDVRGRAPIQLSGLTPSLVRLPTWQMGREGVTELLRLVGEPDSGARHVRLLPDLCPGNSTAHAT